MNLLQICIIFLIKGALAKYDTRIVGGAPANITEFPYQVSVRRGSAHICGGSIIHPCYILTAGHCVFGQNPKLYSIRAGSNYFYKNGVIVSVCSVKVHENFDSETMVHDIAILKLCTSLNFSMSILPIALADTTDTITKGTKALISGWGYTKEDGSVAPSLRQVEVPIISNARCSSLYRDEIITTGMICAGYMGEGKKDACQGDSGGPLRAKGKQYGVVSWGYGCARPMFPGVYTFIPKYRDWIRTVTNY